MALYLQTMKQIITLALALLPTLSISCPDIYGKWKSSSEMTMRFTDKWAKIENRSFEFLKQITGTAEIEYQKNKMILTEIPKRNIIVNGKTMPWEGTNETVAFEVLGCTNNGIAIKYNMSGIEYINLLYFENNDTYWEYAGRPEFTGSAHIREYFVRESSFGKK